MADTVRTLSALQALLTPSAGSYVDAQDERDALYSTLGVKPYVAKTANYTLTENDEWVTVDTTSGVITITLPGCLATRVGKTYLVQKIAGANNVSVARAGSDTINGATSKTVSTQYSGILLVNTGTVWYAVALSAA